MKLFQRRICAKDNTEILKRNEVEIHINDKVKIVHGRDGKGKKGKSFLTTLNTSH